MGSVTIQRVLQRKVTIRRLIGAILLGALSLAAIFGLWLAIMFARILTSGRINCLNHGIASCFGNQKPEPEPMTVIDNRPVSDWEVSAKALSISILRAQNSPSYAKPAKVALMFLTPGPLPLEKVWARFLKGNERRYSIYVHASDPNYRFLKENTATDIFVGREIPSHKVGWGEVNMIDAERRLLAWALLDPMNQVFVLLSDACIPVRGFNYIHDFLMQSKHSFVDNYVDEGQFGWGRHDERMGPLIEKKKFTKGSQWFAMKRHHATAVVADTLFYDKFSHFCNFYEQKNCIPDEHYVQTFLNVMDPHGMANFSVTLADWSKLEYHPFIYHKDDVNATAVRSIQKLTSFAHPYANSTACMWNGWLRPCYLFARKFDPDSVEALLKLPSSVLGY